jgi:trans-2,3-dihydro-3-hydroxyanthranilate isomerase
MKYKKHYSFYTCDVFTDTQFGGNPLAVIPDAAGLSREQMQLIAREFNFSETTFVLPPEQGQTRRVRIFTRQSELPFAGHPNVGTAYVLASRGEFGEFEHETQVVFEEGAGLVAVTIRRSEHGFWAELKAPQPVQTGSIAPVQQVAQALTLSPDDILVERHPPREASVGLPFIMAEMRDIAALERITLDFQAFEPLLEFSERGAVLAYVRTGPDVDIRARMFAPLGGTHEDPATGSANSALAGFLARLDPAQDADFSWRIAQGQEMGRPSILDARAEKRAGDVTGVWIGGESKMITQGEILLE